MCLVNTATAFICLPRTIKINTQISGSYYGMNKKCGGHSHLLYFGKKNINANDCPLVVMCCARNGFLKVNSIYSYKL